MQLEVNPPAFCEYVLELNTLFFVSMYLLCVEVPILAAQLIIWSPFLEDCSPMEEDEKKQTCNKSGKYVNSIKLMK